jgi:regulator of replication initiation timing
MAMAKFEDLLGMSEEEMSNLSEEEVQFYSETVRVALEQTSLERINDPEIRESVKRKAEDRIRIAKEAYDRGTQDSAGE